MAYVFELPRQMPLRVASQWPRNCYLLFARFLRSAVRTLKSIRSMGPYFTPYAIIINAYYRFICVDRVVSQGDSEDV